MLGTQIGLHRRAWLAAGHMVTVVLYASLLVAAWLPCSAIRSGSFDQEHVSPPPDARGVPIIEPVPDSTKLRVSDGGLQLLRSMTGRLAPVVVIGPYRSGKSFLINQMLDIPCDSGMEVGHQRTTQTRGVWLWSKPVPVRSNGTDALAATRATGRELPPIDSSDEQPLSMLFFDTEGFESTGQSDAYDDRIFAFAAILGSTLIYNLAEAVRESDIEKLAFAVELATAFYPHYNTSEHGAAGAPVRRHLEPLHMVWCIQRDFLQGKTTQAALDEALAPVPNPQQEASIDQVNRIRASVSALASDSVAFGLPQPHLERTKLCELPDSELSPAYLESRERLRRHLHDTARVKTLRGRPLDGPGAADLVVALVDALNTREMPTSGSMLEAFNQQLLHEVLDQHLKEMEAVELPAAEVVLRQHHQAAAVAAFERLHRESFGEVEGVLDPKLQKLLDKELADLLNRNEVQSARICERLESECEQHIEKLANMALPSLGRFDAKSHTCVADFRARCVGPAAPPQAQRLEHALEREKARFRREYNDRLYGGLVVVSLALAVVCRFLLRRMLLEFVCWGSFLFLELYPKITFGVGNMYKSFGWRKLVAAWELVIYNPVLDLETWWLPLSLVAAAAVLCYRNRARLWQRWLRSKQQAAAEAGRDLSV